MADLAQWLKCWPVDQRVAGLIPSQGHIKLGCRFPALVWAHADGSQSMCLSHVVKLMEKMSSVRTFFFFFF